MSNKAHYFKYEEFYSKIFAKKQFLLKVETTNLFHHMRKNHTIQQNQATKERMLAADDV